VTQFTQQAITKAFLELLNEEPFDKITVIEIARRCGINRNTFYYHYDDVYALVDEMFRAETQKIIDEHKEFSTWQEGFLEATAFARENKTAIYHIYDSINRESLETYLYDVTYNNMLSFIEKQAKGLSVSEDDIRDLTIFYTAALEGLVLEWLHDGMRVNPENYIESMGRLLDGNIRYTLTKSGTNNLTLPAGADQPEQA